MNHVAIFHVISETLDWVVLAKNKKNVDYKPGSTLLPSTSRTSLSPPTQRLLPPDTVPPPAWDTVTVSTV